MREEYKVSRSFEKLLKARFPILYNGLGVVWRDGGIGHLEVGVGWYGLLYELGLRIEPELEMMPKKERGSLVQIKEKFARLTFYFVRNKNEKIDNAISEIAKISLETCEWCGKKGKLSDLGWMKTLCDECHEKRIEEQKRGGSWIAD